MFWRSPRAPPRPAKAALSASGEVGDTAETLRSEVTDFLAAMSQGDETERRTL